MEDNTTTLHPDSNRSPLQDLALELSVDIEALEERLEMVAIDPVLCCIINGSCTVHPAPK
jgi:hypothetical protein